MTSRDQNLPDPPPASRPGAELVWEGKYDERGRRRPVDIAGAQMPLQRIEAFDPPPARCGAQGGLFDSGGAQPGDFRNMLIRGDNKLVMASLLRDFRGRIDLIYIDPPFDVGADFSMRVPIGEGRGTAGAGGSSLELVAYNDTWGRGTDTYLHMMYERLVIMRELLADSGSLFLHCAWHSGHYLKAILDEVFGRERLINELIWHYYNKLQGNIHRFAFNHDTIFWYSKTAAFKFHKQREERDVPTRQLKRAWDKKKGAIVNVKDEEGRVVYVESTERTVDDVWRLPMLQPADRTQNLGFATQKPEAVAERILAAASDPGDLVADFFCGSGTTGAVAERLGRRWIMADRGRLAIHTSRKRILEQQRRRRAAGEPSRAFDVFDLGRGERRWWQRERLRGSEDDLRRFVLACYGAEVAQEPASPLLHGRKGAALCHVDDIDGTFTREKAERVAAAAKAAGAGELVCLAWEFERSARMPCSAIERALDVRVELVQIPPEIMEPNRKEPPPLVEIATLEAEPVFHREGCRTTVDIRLRRFVPSLAEVPAEELAALQARAAQDGFDFIDFWAVDFAHEDGGPFRHHWQHYRTRKDRALKTVSEQRHAYPAPGRYTACVKVVDVFGRDTSIAVEVNLG